MVWIADCDRRFGLCFFCCLAVCLTHTHTHTHTFIKTQTPIRIKGHVMLTKKTKNKLGISNIMHCPFKIYYSFLISWYPRKRLFFTNRHNCRSGRFGKYHVVKRNTTAYTSTHTHTHEHTHKHTHTRTHEHTHTHTHTRTHTCRSTIKVRYLPTPSLGQDMTQGRFFKRSLTGLNSELSFS